MKLQPWPLLVVEQAVRPTKELLYTSIHSQRRGKVCSPSTLWCISECESSGGRETGRSRCALGFFRCNRRSMLLFCKLTRPQDWIHTGVMVTQGHNVHPWLGNLCWGPPYVNAQHNKAATTICWMHLKSLYRKWWWEESHSLSDTLLMWLEGPQSHMDG